MESKRVNVNCEKNSLKYRLKILSLFAITAFVAYYSDNYGILSNLSSSLKDVFS